MTKRTRKSINLKGTRSNINEIAKSALHAAKTIGKKGGVSKLLSKNSQ